MSPFEHIDLIVRADTARSHIATTNHAKQLSELSAAVNYVLCDIVFNKQYIYTANVEKS